MDISHLVNGNECLVTYNLTNEYVSRTAIAQKGSDDISTALESTLHRILESGGSPDDILEIMGAIVPTDEEMIELEEFEEFISLDLGYVLPGLMTCWEVCESV